MRRLIPAVVLVTAAVVLIMVLLTGPLSSPPVPPPEPTATAAAPALGRVSTVLSSEFEDGTDGWEGLGSATVSTREGDARTGGSSLLASGRTEAWNGALLDLTGSLTPGTEHTLSVWVRLAPGSPEQGEDQLQLTVRRDVDGQRVHDHLVHAPVGSDDWVELRTAYTLPAG